MASETRYPHDLSQTSGSPFRKFTNMANVKNNHDTYAISDGDITSKSGSHRRPSTVTASDFRCNIPAGSKITKITVEYVNDYNGDISIAGPTVDLLNVSAKAKKGKALTKTLTRTTLSWTGNFSVSKVNSAKFGVKINYPSNTKSTTGKVKIKYIRVVITYNSPNFSVSATRLSGKYTSTEHTVRIVCNNKGKTDGGTNVTATLPAGVSFVRKDSGSGSVSVKGSNLTWKTGIGSKSSVNVVIRVRISTNGSHRITFRESATNHTGSVNLTSSAKPVTPPDPDEKDSEKQISDEELRKDYSKIVHVAQGERFTINPQFTAEEIENSQSTTIQPPFGHYFVLSVYENPDFAITDFSQETAISSAQLFTQYLDEDGTYHYPFYSNIVREVSMVIWSRQPGSTVIRQIDVEVYPAGLTTPIMAIYSLLDEEKNRLGGEYSYSVTSWCKEVTDDIYVRDWKKNFRIAVFNNKIEENCSIYYLQESTNDELSGFLQLSPLSDLDDGYLVVNSDNPITMAVNWLEGQETFDIDDSDTSISINDELYTIPVLFEKKDEDEVILTIKQYDGEDTLQDTLSYHVHFNADQNTELKEIEIDSTDYSNLSKDDIFKYAEFWGEPLTQVNDPQELECEFVFDENYPVHILIVGDFEEGDPENSIMQFSPPVLRQSDDTNPSLQCIFGTPIRGVVNEELTNLALNSFETSNTHVFYDFDLEDIETNENNSILGIQINMVADFEENMSVLIRLKDPNGRTGERSVSITNDDANERIITVGGPFDLWGFDVEDMVNMDLWEVEAIFSNSWLSETESRVTVEKIEMIVCQNYVEDTAVICYLNGKDTRHYGMFVKSVEVPAGLNSEVKYLEIDGSDQNEAYRQNIAKKEITIKFAIIGCTIEESTALLKMIGSLFSNDRDELNNPIENRLEFSHYPGEYWNVVLEDAIDSDVEAVDYDSTLKLIVPDGTSHSTDEIVTSFVGNTTSIAKIHPMIQLIPTAPLLDAFEIVETRSNQKMKIDATGIEASDLLILDCENRRLIVRRYNSDENIYADQDISLAVDWNADWFSLYGEYYFETSGCVIQTVTFEERW